MASRVQTLSRIVAVKEHQRRAAEWRLARLRQEELAVLDDQRGVLAAMNADQALHGLFVETMARHLRIASERLEALRKEIAARLVELEAETRQLKRAEKMLQGARREAARGAEAKALVEAIEAAFARSGASLP